MYQKEELLPQLSNSSIVHVMMELGIDPESLNHVIEKSQNDYLQTLILSLERAYGKTGHTQKLIRMTAAAILFALSKQLKADALNKTPVTT